MVPSTILLAFVLCLSQVAATISDGQIPLLDYTAHNDTQPSRFIRVKKSSLCDGTVKAYTGYVDVGANHLFFQYFESRRDPQQDPVIFWTNGGPGCSSALGLYMEHGPCRIAKDGSIKRNRYSWNEVANIIYIDQPVGVGFSYRDDGGTIGTTEEAAKDAVAFLTIFFDHFSYLKGRPLHLAGESYGGRYLPVFAVALLDQKVPLNLSSIILANALVDMYNQIPGAYDIQCTNASGIPPPASSNQCALIKAAVQPCLTWYKAACEDILDISDCRAALDFCEGVLNEAYVESGRNLFDISKMCDGNLESLCYETVTKPIINFLSLQTTQDALAVDPPARTDAFHSCSGPTKRAFDASNDVLHTTRSQIAELLEQDVRVLVYNGDYDFVGNWQGAQRWTERLNWSGSTTFRASKPRKWTVGGRYAGMWRDGAGLAFATIHAAGHMAPYDKPEEFLALINRWLDSCNV